MMLLRARFWTSLTLLLCVCVCACARSRLPAAERTGRTFDDQTSPASPGSNGEDRAPTGTPDRMPSPVSGGQSKVVRPDGQVGPGVSAGVGGSGDRPRANASLCDGSDAIWLGFTNTSGFHEGKAFSEPYGNVFLFLDGHCDFYVRKYGRLVIGQVSEGVAKTLAARVGMTSIQETDQWHEDTCDEGEARLRVFGHSLACACGCDANAPAWVETAMYEAFRLADELLPEGEPATGPLAVIGRGFNDDDGRRDLRGLDPWPLSVPIGAVPGLIQEPFPGPEELASEGIGAVFVGEDAARLRALDEDLNSSILTVREDGVGYWLYLRDEFPPAAERAVRAFLDSAIP